VKSPIAGLSPQFRGWLDCHPLFGRAVAPAVCLVGFLEERESAPGRAVPFREETFEVAASVRRIALGGGCLHARKEERSGSGGGDQRSVRVHGERQRRWRARRRGATLGLMARGGATCAWRSTRSVERGRPQRPGGHSGRRGRRGRWRPRRDEQRRLAPARGDALSSSRAPEASGAVGQLHERAVVPTPHGDQGVVSVRHAQALRPSRLTARLDRKSSRRTNVHGLRREPLSRPVEPVPVSGSRENATIDRDPGGSPHGCAADRSWLAPRRQGIHDDRWIRAQLGIEEVR
jgi:hypothetical protein